MKARILPLRTLVIAGLLAGFLLSPKLWTSARFYPQTPVWSALHPLPVPFDRIVFGALLLALIAGLFARPRLPLAAFLVLAAALAALDQSRWQPWFYQYVFMLLALAFTAPERAANTCRLILVSIYFWSGLQKLNPGFFHDTFPWLMEPIKRHVHADALLQFAFVVPLVETGIGIALLTRRTRKPALIVAAAMHGFILLMIGPLGQRHNSVVWSWNIVIALAAFLLFWKAPDFSARDVLQPRGARFHALVLALFTLAPALSFFNAWDHYLSWSLYSGNKTDADIYMTDAVANKLPGEVLEFVTEEGPDRNGLNIHEWSFGELNVPAYPEQRIYRNVARYVCLLAAKPGDVTLVLHGKIALRDSRAETTWTCPALTSAEGSR